MIKQKEKHDKDTESRILWLQWSRLKLLNKVLYRKYTEEDQIRLQFVVPTQMRSQILYDTHDSWCNIHLGTRYDTIDKLDNRYYWPRITCDFIKYMRVVNMCYK